jgi:hypothetical protein
MIYHSRQEGTRARPGRRVRIVNLGLEPEEALGMGLSVETVKRDGEKKKEAPVADYVPDPWRKWLQAHRVELNAMTTPQFLDWLDRKFAAHAGKIIPPSTVLADRLEQEVREDLERRITDRVLRCARVPDRVEEAFKRREPTISIRIETLEADVRRGLQADPSEPWGSPIRRIARSIATGGHPDSVPALVDGDKTDPPQPRRRSDPDGVADFEAVNPGRNL